MSIGELLKSSRKKAKITQKELGQLLGKSERTIQNYEGDKIVPPLDVLKNIASILNTDINYFINVENKKSWEKNIHMLAEYMGLNMDSFSNAPIELKEKFLNDIADIPIYKMQIQAVLNLIKKIDDKDLQNLIYSMIESLVNELNIKNEKINNLELKLQKISEIIIDTKGDDINGNKEE